MQDCYLEALVKGWSLIRVSKRPSRLTIKVERHNPGARGTGAKGSVVLCWRSVPENIRRGEGR